MTFYENTIIARQDLAENELKKIKDKYNNIINTSSGKVVKIEEWGILNLANKIKNYKKGFYIHFKFEGNKDTLKEAKSLMLNNNLVLIPIIDSKNIVIDYLTLTDIVNETNNKKPPLTLGVSTLYCDCSGQSCRC